MSTVQPVPTMPVPPGRDDRHGALQRYASLKLELAAIVRSIMQLAQQRRDGALSGACRDLLARLAEDRFNLAVVGQFSRGKTSLMNALLGADRLPTGLLPLTSVITTVCYGDRERVLVQRKGWPLPQEVPLDALPEYVTQTHNPGNQKQVVLAEVQLPVELLRLGFSFIDTPGVGSLVAANTAATREFLPEADAAIFVTSFEAPLGESELDFLEQVRRHMRKIFVVINKLDLAPADRRAEVVTFVRDRLGQAFGDAAPPVFAVSAREGLLARLGGDEERLARSGLLDLESALIAFLRTDKAREALARTADRAARLLSRQELELELSADLDPELAGSIEAQIRSRLEDLRHEQERVVEALRQRAATEFPKRVERDLAEWCAEIRAVLARQVQDELSDADMSTLANGHPGLAERVEATCRERLRAWLAEHQRFFERVIREVIAEDAARLHGLILDMVRCGPETAHNSRGPAAGGGGDSASPDEFTELMDGLRLEFPEVPPCRWRCRVPWWCLLLRGPRMRGLLVDRCLKSLEAALSGYRQEVRSALEAAAWKWVDQLGQRLAAKTTAIAARVDRIVHLRASADEFEVIAKLRTSLEAVRAAIAILGAADAGAPPVTQETLTGTASVGSDVTASCLVCARVGSALFEFMSRRQYELGTSERYQLAHAERGGFCPLHTWQYAAIASPHGICLAYPPVLESLAGRLRGLASGAPSSGSLAEGVRRLLPRPVSCEVCRLIGAVEQAAARDLLSEPSAGSASGPARKLPALCLPHLYVVLAAGPDARLARLLVEEQARVLERLAEDMRRYALKHEAIRRQLATDEERRAHRRGLARVAGEQRITVAPDGDDEPGI